MRLLLRLFPAVGGLLLFALLCAGMVDVATANAATLIVTNTADSGPGSLRQALADAHDGDIIGFDPALNGQTISLTSSELLLNKDISISGPGSDLLTVSRSQDAPQEFRIIHIMPSHTVALQSLTISGGFLPKFDPSPPGAGIFNEQGTLTIDSCAVSSNFSFYDGGGIYNTGTLTVSHSAIIGNFGGFGGGGISNSGTLTIMNSMVRNNRSGVPGVGPGTGYGAGISNTGMATIVSSTIDHNTADGGNQGSSSSGGGINNGGSGSLTVSDSTISQNVAVIAGGAISGGGSITNCTISGNSAFQGAAIYRGATITNCTISGNTASQNGASIYVTSALEIGNTILNAGANSANIRNDGGTVTSHGYNLSSDNGGGFLTATGDQINTDPMLGPLQNNGGPTFTHDLLTGSPAIDAGDPNFTPPPLYDQRGFGYARVFNGRIDIGSLEVQPAFTPSPTPTATSTATPTATATAIATATSTATATATATVTATAAATATATATVATSTPTPTPFYTRVFWEGFDAVTAPALPAGWVASFTAGPANCTQTGTCALGTNWVTSSATSQTAPNAAFHNAPSCVTDSNLDTPSIFIPTSFYPSVIYFWQNYNLESGHDGGVLEISINGGAFTDIVTAGGSFLGGGYNGTISTAFLSPIAGRQAWTGNSGGYINTSASLPSTAMGHNVVLRFRLATDCSGGGPGWYVDSIQIAYFNDVHPTPTATAAATPTPTPPLTISGTISYCSNPAPGPVPNVTLTLTGSASGSTLSDSSGNYSFSGLTSGGSYTVTPTKTALMPGATGINTVDVVATQRHFLNIGTPLSGCRLMAADVNGDTAVNTVDVIAIQRFYLIISTGIANTGKYQFNPANRIYPGIVSNQTGQNYDTLVFGDVVAPFAE